MGMPVGVQKEWSAMKWYDTRDRDLNLLLLQYDTFALR